VAVSAVESYYVFFINHRRSKSDVVREI